MFDDCYHAYMAKHYKETPWWWYTGLLVFSLVLGWIVTATQEITLPV